MWTDAGECSQGTSRVAAVLVVRDAPRAHDVLSDHLAGRDDVRLIGHVPTGTAAIQAARRHCPDIVLAHVRLADMTGFDRVRRLTDPPFACSPLVVFLAGDDDQALRAFDCGAVDYIVEPFADDRLMRAVDRVVARQHERWAIESLLDVLMQCERALPGAAIQGRFRERGALASASRVDPSCAASHASHVRHRSFRERFLIRVGARDAVVETADITWIRANGCYATLVTTTAPTIPRAGAKLHAVAAGGVRVGERVEYLIRVSLDQLEQELDPARFLRVHRSAIACIERIRGTERSPRRGIVVVLDDGTRIPVSRSRRPALLRALGGQA